MKKYIISSALVALSSTAAMAGGLDRSGQPIGLLFEKGNYGEFSFGRAMPSLTGQDSATTQPIGNVADDFSLAAAGVKYQLNEQLSFALIVDEPFGADIQYPGNPAASGLGGTTAIAQSNAITALGRYQFGNGFSIHGGLRSQTISGDITLSGLAYGPLNGYSVNLQEDRAYGYVIGAAYEIPDIAMRVALTYNSEIKHELNSVERLRGAVVNPGSVTEVRTPESYVLDFQTGVAADTLVFGSIRYANWSKTVISPRVFNARTRGQSLTNIDDTIDVTIGVGRKFTEKFSASVSLGYLTKQDDDLVSPLSPSNGAVSIGLGASYQLEKVTISGGVRYTKLGDARPATANTARATFTGNDAVSVGVKVGYRF
ncbi:OmpP1/FadL family transporter [Brevirhabdus sp.]|uniref:OmpP1/FadL family transporter n=1 Tax=Brevirhabdus sp. TaxID=2004514 RepID=UPI00405821C7